MRFSDYLAQEWRLTLGCTEPACIAYAAACAAACLPGPVTRVHLVCDPRIYKNCYAVGIPHSGHKVGIRWSLALGACLPDPALKLECFKSISPDVLKRAESLINAGKVTVSVDTEKRSLYVCCRVETSEGRSEAVIADEHTRLVKVSRDGRALTEVGGVAVQSERAGVAGTEGKGVRALVAEMTLASLIDMARSLTDEDRRVLREGTEYNLAIARHGLSLFPETFVDMAREDALTRFSRFVCAGVYARMCGEDFTVMSLAGSGNKGITCAVPLVLFGRDKGAAQNAIDEALALACLVTSMTTHWLGTLSAVCGCSNAAGIGLSAGVVLLEGGGADAMSLAIKNMVGNVTGMICDGAKMGCALKTMTSVDAAFRSASLALSGIGIPVTDGIVAGDGLASLKNLGRIATRGMPRVDDEILAIMQEKLDN